MKFRIVEIHRKHMVTLYRPEYKPGWFFWINVSDSFWASTIMCHYKFEDCEFSSFVSYDMAKNCIDDFKKYLNENKSFDIIHEIE